MSDHGDRDDRPRPCRSHARSGRSRAAAGSPAPDHPRASRRSFRARSPCPWRSRWRPRPSDDCPRKTMPVRSPRRVSASTGDAPSGPAGSHRSTLSPVASDASDSPDRPRRSRRLARGTQEVAGHESRAAPPTGAAPPRTPSAAVIERTRRRAARRAPPGRTREPRSPHDREDHDRFDRQAARAFQHPTRARSRRRRSTASPMGPRSVAKRRQRGVGGCSRTSFGPTARRAVASSGASPRSGSESSAPATASTSDACGAPAGSAIPPSSPGGPGRRPGA